MYGAWHGQLKGNQPPHRGVLCMTVADSLDSPSHLSLVRSVHESTNPTTNLVTVPSISKRLQEGAD